MKKGKRPDLIPQALTQPDAMNPDDESLLSAYLDNELDPADRLAFEWAIETNPALAEQYRSLVQMRSAVSSLPRPEIPRDLAATINARLVANRRRQRFEKFARPVQVIAAFSGFSAIAASLIFALILLNHSLHESDQPGPVVTQPTQNLRPHQPAPDSILVPPVENPQLVANAAQPSPRPVVLPPAPALPGQADQTRELGARQTVAAMLEQSHVRRVRIVTDVLNAPEMVKNLIIDDGRLNPNFGQISICQEIVLDPDYPGTVVVFAVPMNERDRRAFVSQLAKPFPGLVEETEETRPDLVTDLTQVGQVALFRGTEAAPLVDPPHDLRPFIANRTEIAPIHIVDSARPPITPDRRPVSGNDRPADTTQPVASPRDLTVVAKPSAELKPDDPVTLLVWVVRPPPRL